MTAASSIGVGDLRAAFETAERWLALNRDAVNAINVYPVPDGDTGTNMLLTWRAALGAAPRDAATAGEYLRAVARGALLGARGNSGVILSQMLRGLAHALEGADDVDCESLCRALAAASQAAYDAVPEPVEGTMLTVMREAAAAAGAALPCAEVAAALHAFVEEARASVDRTPDLLPRLREAGVVDAGGLGVALLFEGVKCGVSGEPLPEPLPSTAPVEVSAVPHHDHGYCTEFVVTGRAIDRHALERRLSEAGGESVLVVGDEDAVHVHVHARDPGPALSAGVAFGALASVKVEDMQAQHEEWVAAHEAGGAPSAAAWPAARLGLVAVARGEGLAAAFRDLGAARIVSGGPTGKPSAGELLDAARAAGREHAVILPNDKDVLMAADAAAREAPGFVTVVPTRSVVAGLAAAVAYLPDGDPADVTAAMREAAEAVRCIEVTRAVRDASVDGVAVREGEAIAFLDGVLVASRESLEDALADALGRVEPDGTSIATVYLGRDAPTDAGDRVVEVVTGAHPGLEVEVLDGGQPHYPYIVSIE